MLQFEQFPNDFDFIDDLFLDSFDRDQLLAFQLEHAPDFSLVEETTRICRKCFS